MMIRKLKQFVSYLLYCFGVYVVIFECLVYNILNPELTQMQVLIEKCPWVLGGFVAFAVAFKVYPEVGRG